MERQLDSLNKKTLNRNSVVLRLAVSAFALTAFCIIAYKVSLGNTETFDRKVSEIVYSFRNSFSAVDLSWECRHSNIGNRHCNCDSKDKMVYWGSYGTDRYSDICSI